MLKLTRSLTQLDLAPSARALTGGQAKSVRVRNRDESEQAKQRDIDNWEKMVAKEPSNHIEKNLLLLSQAARLTIDNTEQPTKKKKPQFGRRGRKAKGHENPHAIPLGVDGRNPPWYMSIPKHNFKTDGVRFVDLSLGSLQHKIDRGILNPAKITMYDLVSQKIVNIPKDYSGIRLSIQGISLLEAKINIEVSMACDRTIEAIERNGGTVLTRWYSRESLEAMYNGNNPTHIDLPPKTYVHKYLSTDLRGYMVGKEHLFFRRLGNATKMLKFKEQEDAALTYDDEDHRDIIQERIDANVQHLKEMSGTT